MCGSALKRGRVKQTENMEINEPCRRKYLQVPGGIREL